MNKIMSLVLISLFSGQLFSMNDQNNIISSKNFNEKFFTENEIKIQEIVNSGQKIVNSGQMVHPSVEEENILNFSDSDDEESSKDSEDYQDAEIFSKDKENVFFDSSFTEAEVKELKYNLKIKAEVLKSMQEEEENQKKKTKQINWLLPELKPSTKYQQEARKTERLEGENRNFKSDPSRIKTNQKWFSK